MLTNLINMNRLCQLLIFCWLVCGTSWAEGDLAVVERKPDRTVIYPQRMELVGEETLLDVLQMVPDLMIEGYEDIVSNYNLRIDNGAMNGDPRLILSSMKAKDVACIQVCDNTGVAKGNSGMGRVLDINMAVKDTMKGSLEGQADMGRNLEGIGNVNVLYGNGQTDIYANASYRYQDRHKEFLTLHMTNRFDRKNRLLTYFTQQYMELPADVSRKVMGRARFFHTFNELGTELLLVGGCQYASDATTSNTLPLVNIELNTPLLTEQLHLMLGVESDFLMTKQKQTNRSWDVFNHDFYLQLTYGLPKWKLSMGSRVSVYDYRLKDGHESRKNTDTRDNSYLCAIYVPNSRHQILCGYYRKYINPSVAALFMGDNTLSDEEWAVTKGQLAERTINQMKMTYAYSRQKLTVQVEASYITVDDGDNFTELGASAYWKLNWLTLTGGSNLYMAKSGSYASVRFSPKVYIPHMWQIGLQAVFYTKQSPIRRVTGEPVYGCVSVNKQIGSKWNLGVDWHDMFDAVCSDVKVNRHAANIKLQYRF